MTLSIPRYPEFADLPRQEKYVFYVPELEMCWKEICCAMKKSWKGYKIARREADTERQKYYADIISGIVEGLVYSPIRLRMNADAGVDENFIVFDEGAEDQEYISEEHEVAEMEGNIHKRRAMAIEYGRRFEFDWDEITKQYVKYITPEESEECYLMAMDDEQEVRYETI
jgi:hypothetical protein